MSRARRVFAACFLMALLSGADALAQAYYELYAAGMSAVNGKQWDVVIEKMTQAIKLEPAENDRARSYGANFFKYHPYYYRGIAYFNKGQYKLAIADLQRALDRGDVNLGTPDSWLLRAEQRVAIGMGQSPASTAPPAPPPPVTAQPAPPPSTTTQVISAPPPAVTVRPVRPPSTATQVVSAPPPAAATTSRVPEHRPEPATSTGEFAADEAVRTYGNIAFNTPEEMQLGESLVIQLLLDPGSVTEAELGRQIVEPGAVQTSRIKISENVEAILSGSAFEIRAITPQVQAMSAHDPTEWRWEIVAKEAGTQRLFLTINALIPPAEGSRERRRAVKSFDREIVVTVRAPVLLSPQILRILLVAGFLVVALTIAWQWRRSRHVPAVPSSATGAEAEQATQLDINAATVHVSGEGGTQSLQSSTPLSGSVNLAVGDVLADRYTIVRFLGKGGMGAVYAATDRELEHEMVALKTLLPSTGADEQAIRRFRREIQYARKVAHPNVCRLYDLGQHRIGGNTAPLLFVTMEYIEGITLSQHMRSRGRLTESEALPIIVQIAEGLEATHRTGLVHRDVKPGNVMLSREGSRVVLMDFGLARLSSSDAGDASMTQSGAVVGSPMYMAPEQLEGKDVSAATDIYAFGAIIYELITGQKPFDGDSAVTLIAKRLHENPVPPSARCTGVAPLWEDTILRCLARAPADRYQSAADVARALRGTASADASQTSEMHEG